MPGPPAPVSFGCLPRRVISVARSEEHLGDLGKIVVEIWSSAMPLAGSLTEAVVSLEVDPNDTARIERCHESRSRAITRTRKTRAKERAG
jgi:hypothetical protein